MKPPHPPRSAGDLPKRVPGSGKSVSSGSGPVQDGSTASGPAETRQGTPGPRQASAVPRLSQISSLGSPRNSGRPQAADRRTGDDPVVALEPATGRKGRREGLRGALGVVGVVGLLAVAAVALTLGLVRGGDDSPRDDASVSVDSDGHGSDVTDALGDLSGPSAHASATESGKEPDSAKKPSKAASPRSSGESEASAKPDAGSPDSAENKAGSDSTASATAPGVSVSSHASGRCIDVVGGKAVQGAALMIWDCNGSAAQHWTFTGGTMRTLGMCVQLAGGSTDDGTDLQLASCNGSADQQFDLNVRSDLVNPLADKCTDVRDNQTANGSRLQLWSCSGGENQKWSSS